MPKNQIPPLEEGLLQALQAIDKQVAREMQRTPEETEQHGVQKWEPYQKRVELVAGYVLDKISEQEIQLDGVLVLAQAFSKALYLLTEELGTEALGKLRSTYCSQAFEVIELDARRGKDQLKGQRDLV